MLPLSPRQYEVLKVFVSFKQRRKHKRPSIGDIRDSLGAKSRAGVYCGHIVPLLAKGYIERDLPAFERRGYYITPRGLRAYNARKRQDAQNAKQSSGKD